MFELNKIYKRSKNIIEREIEGEMVIIPSASGVVDLENVSVFSLNDTAKEIWSRINGEKAAIDIIGELDNLYEVDKERLINDIMELLEELIANKLVLEVK